jgi:hypothetical protein
MAICMMDQRKEQSVCIKICANLRKIVTETLTMIQQDFGCQILSHTQLFQWHARFETGCTSVDDDEHTGRPTSCTIPETVARIQGLVCQDRHQTVHNITEGVGIGYGTCQQVLTVVSKILWAGAIIYTAVVVELPCLVSQCAKLHLAG